jgi:hypothetical protein
MTIVHVEYLFHYNCEFCKQWWTIGDKLIRAAVVCPKCSSVQTVDKVVAHSEAPVIDEIVSNSQQMQSDIAPSVCKIRLLVELIISFCIKAFRIFCP